MTRRQNKAIRRNITYSRDKLMIRGGKHSSKLRMESEERYNNCIKEVLKGSRKLTGGRSGRVVKEL
jgi:hypothetical protein